jgi:hypothetical protein
LVRERPTPFMLIYGLSRLIHPFTNNISKPLWLRLSNWVPWYLYPPWCSDHYITLIVIKLSHLIHALLKDKMHPNPTSALLSLGLIWWFFTLFKSRTSQNRTRCTTLTHMGH